VTVVLHGIRRFETPDGGIEAASGKIAVLPARIPHRPVRLDRATTSINLYLQPRRGAAVVPAAALVLQLPSWMALGTIPDPGKVADWLDCILPDITSSDAALNEDLIASVVRAPTSTSAAAAWGFRAKVSRAASPARQACRRPRTAGCYALTTHAPCSVRVSRRPPPRLRQAFPIRAI